MSDRTAREVVVHGKRCRIVGRVHLRSDRNRRHLPAESCHFDGLRSELDVRQAETPADDPAIAKELLDVMRMRRRADVEVFRPPVQQQIANTPADQVRYVVVFMQPIKDFERVGVDVAA